MAYDLSRVTVTDRRARYALRAVRADAAVARRLGIPPATAAIMRMATGEHYDYRREYLSVLRELPPVLDEEDDEPAEPISGNVDLLAAVLIVAGSAALVPLMATRMTLAGPGLLWYVEMAAALAAFVAGWTLHAKCIRRLERAA